MKLTAVLLLGLCLQLSARTYSQTVSLSVKNAALEKVFAAIQKQSGYSFYYKLEILAHAQPVSIDVKNAPLEQVLSLVFKNQPFIYTIVDKNIGVKEKEPEKKEIVPNVAIPEMPPPPPTVHGRITNEKGEPVAGVNISIKGVKVIGVTDDNGEFTLNNVADNSILVFSAVSIETFETKLNGKTELTLNVKTKTIELQEIVVNKGYYSTSQRLNTGSVSRVRGTEIANQPVSNVLEAIEGRMSGVQVRQSSGVSGSGINIEIRGRNSLRNLSNDNGNLPLYIVDGVPISSNSLDAISNMANQIMPLMSPLNALNPADIESVEILKDADATAIYGSRGANGIVIITTKKGRVGKTKVDINFYTGSGKITRMMDLLNSQQYLQMRREAYKNDGVAIPSFASDLNGAWDTTRYTDWQKALIGGTAKTTNFQATISGGNANTQFLFGAGYFSQGTVFPGDFSDQKLSGHLNLTHSSENRRFNSSISVSFLNDLNNLPNADPTTQALQLPPVAPKLYNDNGSLNWQNNTWTNPMSMFLKPYRLNSNNLVFNSTLSYQIITGLLLKASLGYTTTESHQTNLNPIASQNPAFLPLGSSTIGENSYASWIAEPQIEYTRKIGNGELTSLVGATFQQNISQYQSIFTYGYTSDALLENLGSATYFSPSASYTKYKYNAIFGRVNYTYAKKYLVNLTGRRDGSSRFGPGKQFANFGAVGLGWIFSNESFIQNSIPFLSFGKLRGSFGTTGNDQIPDYGYRDAYTAVANPYNGNAGLTVGRLFNPDYSWEENKKLEIGIELGFLKDRVNITSSYFKNRSSNQLIGYPLPTITGQSSLPFYNLPATVENSGWEIELRTVNINSKNFRWSSYANLTIPRNKLLAFPGLESSSYATSYLVGQSIYGRRSFMYQGVDPQTGLFTYQDIDKDNKLSSPNDLGNVKPIAVEYFGGFQNNLSFKGITLDFLVQFVKQTGLNYINKFTPGLLMNQPTKVLERWQKPGDITNVQRYTTGGTGYSTFLMAVNYGDNRISDASFIRLKNVSLSYSVNARFLAKAHITSFRVFAQAQNLITITNYLGLDPETQSFQNLPPLKMLTAGIQVTL